MNVYRITFFLVLFLLQNLKSHCLSQMLMCNCCCPKLVCPNLRYFAFIVPLKTCEYVVVAILLYCVWYNLLVALIGMWVWHFVWECQLQITSVINLAARWLILGYCFYCLWLLCRAGLDVLQLLFLRYLQVCVNSCHHLPTLTGINCCSEFLLVRSLLW